MRRVLDTNIVVSGLIWGGVPKELLLLADDPRAELFTSLQLLDELTDVISRPKLIRVASNQNRYWPLLGACVAGVVGMGRRYVRNQAGIRVGE